MGGEDSALYEEPLLYTPVVKEWYYEVLLTDIQINGESLPLSCASLNTDKTIVDSGTTNLRLPRNVFAAAVELFKKHTKVKLKHEISSYVLYVCHFLTMNQSFIFTVTVVTKMWVY